MRMRNLPRFLVAKGFGLRKFTLSNSEGKGFTLIELLVVIAVLGVLAAGVWVALDPLDKINAANDAKVQSDMGILGQAQETYATTHNGYYARSQADLVDNGDLKAVIAPPAGYNIPAGNVYFFTLPASCTISGTSDCTSVVICSELKSKKNTPPPPYSGYRYLWMYSSVSGRACLATFTNTSDPCGDSDGSINFPVGQPC